MPAIAFVQGKANGGYTTPLSSMSVVLDATVGSGNLLIVITSGSKEAGTVTDDQGNTYVRANNYSNGFTEFYAKNVTNAPQTITYTPLESSTFMRILVHEVSGAHLTAPYLGSVVKTQTAPGTGSDAVTSPPLTPGVDGAYIMGVAINNTNEAGAPFFTAGASPTAFTKQVTTTSGLGIADIESEDFVQTTSASIAATFTFNQASDNTTCIVTMWAPAGTAGGPIAPSAFYLDNAAAGSNNGTSWTDAWQSFAVVDYGVIRPGDTLYVSGGVTSKTYNEAISPHSGANGVYFTISTGQDASHNGTVIMNPSGADWLTERSIQYLHITGNVGGAKKMQVTGTGWLLNSIPAPTVSHEGLHLSYIDFGARGYAFYVHPSISVVNFELDHSNLEKTASGTNSMIENMGSVDAYDNTLIHHNTLSLHNDTILGPDLVKWGVGISFYDNTVEIISDGCGTQCGEHTDFFQLSNGHYKIYNNTFEGSSDQGVFISGFGGIPTLTGLLVCNNLFIHNAQPGGVHDAIGLSFFASPSIVVTDVIIANNTFVDLTQTDGFVIVFQTFGSCTNCHVKNNLFKNSIAGNGLLIDNRVSVSNNTALDSSTQFVAYTQYDTAGNDLHLAAGDTVAKDQGVDLSSLGFTELNFDKDGVARPQGAAWDIGAYEYGVRNTPSPVVITRIMRWI